MANLCIYSGTSLLWSPVELGKSDLGKGDRNTGTNVLLFDNILGLSKGDRNGEVTLLVM